MSDLDPSSSPLLVLGSSSKWRRQALSEAGYAFETASPDVDEPAIFEALSREGWPAAFIAITIAEAKTEALSHAYAGRDVAIVAGDQLAEFRGQPRGKPRDADEARAFLRGYRGADVTLVSALAVLHARDAVILSGSDIAVVRYGDLPDDAIERSIKTGDVLRSCGAVVVEDPAIAPYVTIIQGTPDVVSGLPLVLLRDLLGRRFRHPNA